MTKNESVEQRMKERGESKVWKTILSKTGSSKKISSTQIGQQILFSEALKIQPKIREWINESAPIFRKDFQDYFYDDEFLLQKITEILLLMVGSMHVEYADTNRQKVKKTRHKKIKTIQSKILEELSFENVWRIVEVIVDLSQYFTVEKELSYNGKFPCWNIYYKCILDDIIAERLSIQAHSAFFPEPMLNPPDPWSFRNGVLKGGYETFQYELIRTRDKDIDYSLYSQKVFDSINYIQSVPWKINFEQVDIIERDLKLPKKEDFITVDYPSDEGCEWETKTNDPSLSKKEAEKIKEARKVFGEAVELYRAEANDFESEMGKYRAVKLALGIAKQYSEDDVLYFPHSFDFRGRVYPIPVGLSPQGSDAVKSMLEYKDGEKLTLEGANWAFAYLASLYGEDKLPFEERVEKGKELLTTSYLEADEPYQFLAHQRELLRLLDNPDYEFKGRIHLDACNSGSQFTSIITGDKSGCLATNVIPTETENGQERLDAYMLVAEKALELNIEMLEKETDESKLLILNVTKNLLEEKGRKICKKPVMVSNYGGTEGGRAEILWNLMRELKVDRKLITKANASIFAKIIGTSIVGTLKGGKEFERYIQKMNNIISRTGQPIKWRTSDGFYVVHKKNKELKWKQFSCLVPGARRKTTINKKIFSKDLSSAKMRSSISPNYIHSLDAELLRRIALRMDEYGVEYTDWIHDSFGCHPNYVDMLLDITREELLELAKRKPLIDLDRQLRAQADNSLKTRRALEVTTIPNLNEFDIDNGDLDVLLDSEWAFS